MGHELGTLLRTQGPLAFDVICAGEALWESSARGAGHSASSPARRFFPGGGAVNAAVALARQGLRVGLAASIADDSAGRELVARVAATGVDIGGVTLAVPSSGIVVLDGTSALQQVVSYREETGPSFAVPASWASPVVLLSGMTPVVSHAAAHCKAARQARRAGSVVVVDINARRHVWSGRDPRSILSVVREADVVRCSAEDLATLWMDPSALRAAMRPSAVLVVTDGGRPARAAGPFGEIAEAPPVKTALGPAKAGDVFTAALCAHIARSGDPGAERGDMWQRALRLAHAAANGRVERP